MPIAVHTASAAPRLPTVRIIVAGVRKMPTPTTWLTTIAVADHVPSWRDGMGPGVIFPIVKETPDPMWSEGDARADLHRSRAARSEDAARGGDRFAEAARAQEPWRAGLLRIAHQHVREAGVVHVRHTEDVRDVEQVEHLEQRLDAHARSADRERPRDAEIERAEAVVESRAVGDERQQLTIDTAARVQAGDECVEVGWCVKQPSAGVALQHGDAALAVGHQDVHRHTG